MYHELTMYFAQGFPETWQLFQGFVQGKKIEKAHTDESKSTMSW